MTQSRSTFAMTALATVLSTLLGVSYAVAGPAVMRHSCTADLMEGPPRCKPGLVHRLAGPTDFVCVHPDWAQRAQLDNHDAAFNVNPDGSCREDSDREERRWREAFPGDHVCVDRDVQMMTREQNRDAYLNQACN